MISIPAITADQMGPLLADIGVPPALYERLGIRVGPIFARRSLLKLH